MTHPLARLTAAEIEKTRELLAGHLTESTRFAYVGLAEPDKKLVLAGAEIPRQVRVLLLDRASGLGRDCVVDLTAGAVAVVFIIVGGIKYATSQGSAADLQKGKDMIVYALVGLVFVIMAFAIVQLVTQELF